MKKLKAMFCSYQLYQEFIDCGVEPKAAVVLKGKKNRKHVPLVPDKYVNYGDLYLVLPGYKVTHYKHAPVFKSRSLVHG